jgi:hypothetical protein
VNGDILRGGRHAEHDRPCPQWKHQPLGTADGAGLELLCGHGDRVDQLGEIEQGGGLLAVVDGDAAAGGRPDGVRPWAFSSEVGHGFMMADC